MLDLSSIIPYLPFLSVICSGILSAAVPIYLMRLQASKLRKDIEQISQGISTSKATAVKEQVSSLEALERLTTSTAEEMEASLKKSITMRRLLDDVSRQETEITNLKKRIDLLERYIESNGLPIPNN